MMAKYPATMLVCKSYSLNFVFVNLKIGNATKSHIIFAQVYCAMQSINFESISRVVVVATRLFSMDERMVRWKCSTTEFQLDWRTRERKVDTGTPSPHRWPPLIGIHWPLFTSRWMGPR